jgi:hypothetical protein
MCHRLGIRVLWAIPAAGGRSEVFIRDVDMVSKSDLLIVFFDEDRVMQGGTGHLIEKAQDFEVPAYAYVYADGSIERVGEADPENRWASAVPG